MIKCKKPKQTMHRGRTWDSIEIILPNGQRINGRIDTTWGVYAYFYHPEKEHWYKVDTRNYIGDVIDLRKEKVRL